MDRVYRFARFMWWGVGLPLLLTRDALKDFLRWRDPAALDHQTWQAAVVAHASWVSSLTPATLGLFMLVWLYFWTVKGCMPEEDPRIKQAPKPRWMIVAFLWSVLALGVSLVVPYITG